MKIAAPAKLNLSLRVLGRRDDGFHEIDSVMVTLPGLADQLTLELAERDAFHCDGDDLPTDGRNLVIRARDAFRQGTGLDVPVSLRLEKRIPAGAGLGGGSSDAAATLRAMNEQFGRPLEGGSLQEIAAGIGSDVPFFLGPEVARVRGRGERIEPGPSWSAVPVVLLKPAFGVSTPEAYAGWRDGSGAREAAGRPPEIGGLTIVNDLERPVFRKYLFLAEVKAWLRRRRGVVAALMSGSGSTVFAVVDQAERGAELMAAARRELDPTLWAWSGWTGGRPAEAGRAAGR